MKWFQHLTDSSENPKMRIIIRKFNMEGYGFIWVCREIVGKYGDRYRLKAEKDWKNMLQERTGWAVEKIEEHLKFSADKYLICRNSLKKGDLYIPKMKEYSDDYTKRNRRKSEHSTDIVRVDKITIDKIREEYITLKNWDASTLQPDDYARTGKAIKTLYLKAGKNTELAIAGLKWIAEQGYEWTLETLIKKWPDHQAKVNKYKGIPDSLRPFMKET